MLMICIFLIWCTWVTKTKQQMPRHKQKRQRNNNHGRQQELTKINPEAYLEYPIPDTRNERGEYIGPTDFVPVSEGTEYDPDLPGLDLFGKVTLADLRFLEFIHKRPLMISPVTTTSKWNLNPEPENKSLKNKAFKIRVKDKYYPLVVISCSGAVNSIFDLAELKEVFVNVLARKGGAPMDLVLDVRDVTFCSTKALKGFYTQMISTCSDNCSWAVKFFSRVCIVEDKEKNKTLSDLILIISAARVTLKDTDTKSIPFARLSSNEEVEKFRTTTKPRRRI